jgi:hypothetical protein
MVTSSVQLDMVRETLEDYARRGVFRGFCASQSRAGKSTFRMVWYKNRTYELAVDPAKGEFRFVNLLPELPANSPVYRGLKAFVKARLSDDLPEHRRIDPAKANIRLHNRQGYVSLILTSPDDLEYGLRKVIHLAQEIFLSFLAEGINLEYAVETFELDPDTMQ